MIWYSNPNVVGAPVASVGQVAFNDVSAGAFSIPLSPVITPTTIVTNSRAVEPGIQAPGNKIDLANLPVAGITVTEATGARVVTVSITGFAAGAVNGTITANGFNPGDTGILSVLAAA